jgi:hypothetical protein
MKLKFWKKDEEETTDTLTDTGSGLGKDDALTKNFGGPGIPSSTDTPSATPEIKPRFDDFSTPMGRTQSAEPGKPYGKEDLLEAKIDSIKSKMEILDHKLDTIITQLKNVY